MKRKENDLNQTSMITLRDQLALAGWKMDPAWVDVFLIHYGGILASNSWEKPEGMFQPLIFRGLSLGLLFVTVFFLGVMNWMDPQQSEALKHL